MLSQSQHFLSNNICIGVVAPSFFIEKTDNFNLGIEFLRQHGAHIIFGNHVFSKYFNTTAYAQQRADDINRMYANDDIDIIVATDGGCRAIETLPFLDYELIKKHPKPICGFSDITHILLAINARTGQTTFHGMDIINGFGVPKNPYKQLNIDWLNKILCERCDITLPQQSEPYVIKQGIGTGSAVGGWLQVLQNLYGTNLYPQHKDIILFFEAIDTELNAINLMLQSLRLKGMFENVRGMIIGKLTNCDEKEYFDCSPDFDSIILDATQDYSFPIMKNIDFGHGIEHLTLPIGRTIYMDTNTKNIVIKGY